MSTRSLFLLAETIWGVNTGMDTQEIRVVIADDHAVVRAGLRTLLEPESDITIVREVDNGLEALQVARALVPDVLILDMEMPGLRGTEVARRLQEGESPVRVLVLSAYASQQYVLGILASGAAGYLLKEEAPNTLVNAVRQIHRGEYWLSPNVTARLAQPLEDIKRVVDTLSEQERQIFRLVAVGKTNEGISTTLAIPVAQVEKQLEHIFAKLDVATRVEAAVLAVQAGIV